MRATCQRLVLWHVALWLFPNPSALYKCHFMHVLFLFPENTRHISSSTSLLPFPPPWSTFLSLSLHLSSSFYLPPFGSFSELQLKNGSPVHVLSLKVRLVLLSVFLSFLFYLIKWYINSLKEDKYTKGLLLLNTWSFLISTLSTAPCMWFLILLSQYVSLA